MRNYPINTLLMHQCVAAVFTFLFAGQSALADASRSPLVESQAERDAIFSEFVALCARAEAVQGSEKYRSADDYERADLMTAAMRNSSAPYIVESVDSIALAAPNMKYSNLQEIAGLLAGRSWHCPALSKLYMR